METTTISILKKELTQSQSSRKMNQLWKHTDMHYFLQEHITNFQLEITKITGSDVDTERNWKMTKYIPEIPKYLNAYETVIQHIRYLLQDYSEGGNSGAVLAYLDEAEQFIKNMKKYPDDIALHTADLTGAENSIPRFIKQLHNRSNIK